MTDFTSFFNQIKSIEADYSATFVFNNCNIRISANSKKVVDTLNTYFKKWNAESETQVDHDISAFEVDVPDIKLDFKDYITPGKSKVKESSVETEFGILIRKNRTGMHFIENEGKHYVFGPISSFTNQIINYAGALYMQHILDENTQLFHAAAVAKNNEGIVIAAPSGKGKSTTALKLLNEGLDFVSNDRVMLSKEKDNYVLHGVPKYPRVNPGTLLHNNKLKHLLSNPTKYEKMSREELWQWEEKHDVFLEPIYGEGIYKLSAEAKALLIIDWGESKDSLKLEQINLQDHPSLLPEIMKLPALYTPKALAAKLNFTERNYIDFIAELPVFRLHGNIDQKKGVELILDKFFS